MSRQIFRIYHRPNTDAGMGEACGEAKKNRPQYPDFEGCHHKNAPADSPFFLFQ